MEEKISSWQVFWLGVNLVLSTIILIVPSILVGHAGNLGWGNGSNSWNYYVDNSIYYYKI